MWMTCLLMHYLFFFKDLLELFLLYFFLHLSDQKITHLYQIVIDRH